MAATGIKQPRQISNPSYFRAGRNDGATDIPRHRLLTFDTAQDAVKLATAGTDEPAGITSDEAIEAGITRSYQKGGKAIAEAGAAIAVHAWVMPDGNGKAITATSGKFAWGRAMIAAGADGDLVEIEMFESPVAAA